MNTEVNTSFGTDDDKIKLIFKAKSIVSIVDLKEGTILRLSSNEYGIIKNGTLALLPITGVPQNFDEVTACDMDKFNTFFHGMLERGIYLAPSAYEAGFMSIKHSDTDIEASINAADEIFAEMAKA